MLNTFAMGLCVWAARGNIGGLEGAEGLQGFGVCVAGEVHGGRAADGV